MRRTVALLLLSTLLFFGCAHSTEAQGEGAGGDSQGASLSDSGGVPMTPGIAFYEGTFPYGDWRDQAVVFEEDCINDEETALAVAGAILESFQRRGFFNGYEPRTVYHVIEEGIWIVSYSRSRDYMGASFTIAIRQENAEVVLMWPGE